MSDENTPARYRLKPKEFARTNEDANRRTQPIQVEKILQENLRQAAAAEEELDLRRKPSRRRRDYYLLLLAGNGGLLALLAWLPSDPLIRLFVYSAMGVYSVALTWVMWAVMSDY